MKKFIFFVLIFFLCEILSFSENYKYETEKIKIGNIGNEIYGIRYTPNKSGKLPVAIFSHELGMSHKTM